MASAAKVHPVCHVRENRLTVEHCRTLSDSTMYVLEARIKVYIYYMHLIWK